MRKLHDRYFKQAKREGHLARSIYKLEELDRRNRLLRPGRRVLDLGACPGSWLEYVLGRVGEGGVVCAVDLKPIAKRFKDKVFFRMKDVRELTAEDFAGVADAFDVILSDMAPNTSGVKIMDQARSLELAEAAADLAEALLARGGHFVCKVLEGPDFPAFAREMRHRYGRVRIQKPDASRDESMETYLIGLGHGLPPEKAGAREEGQRPRPQGRSGRRKK